MLISLEDCIKANGGKSFEGVIHIGAHHGEEIEAYQKTGVKRCIWAEANKNLMKHLFEHTRPYAVKQQYINEVLSDADGEKVTFNVTNNGQSSSILPLGTHKDHYPHITVVATREVTTKRFDTFYKDNMVWLELENFDMINLDVQGAELKVLKGFGNLLERFSNLKAVYTEVNFEEVYQGAPKVEELDEFLTQFGFKRVLTASTPYGWGDALYLRG